MLFTAHPLAPFPHIPHSPTLLYTLKRLCHPFKLALTLRDKLSGVIVAAVWPEWAILNRLLVTNFGIKVLEISHPSVSTFVSCRVSVVL